MSENIEASQIFAKRIMSILFVTAPHRFQTYLDVSKAGGPSTASLVRLQSAADGKSVMKKPRINLMKTLDQAFAIAGDITYAEVQGTAERYWKESVDQARSAKQAKAESTCKNENGHISQVSLLTQVKILRQQNRELRKAVNGLQETITNLINDADGMKELTP